MRDIKFRAWDKKRKHMYEKVLSFDMCDGAGEIVVGGKDIEYTKPIYVKNVVLMQYTGLKDQNGKEIYEGDIVRTKGMGGGVSGVVEYDSDRAKFVLNMFDVAGSVDKFDDRDLDYGDLDWEYYKILGNIHENPELLKNNNKNTK